VALAGNDRQLPGGLGPHPGHAQACLDIGGLDRIAAPQPLVKAVEHRLGLGHGGGGTNDGHRVAPRLQADRQRPLDAIEMGVMRPEQAVQQAVVVEFPGHPGFVGRKLGHAQALSISSTADSELGKASVTVSRCTVLSMLAGAVTKTDCI